MKTLNFWEKSGTQISKENYLNVKLLEIPYLN